MYNYIHGNYVFGDEVGISDDYLDERWWYIDGAPGYMVSDHGRIWSSKNHRFLKAKPMDREGHLGVCLYVDGERKYVYIHRLMAKAFIENTKNHPIVRHLNDNSRDNAMENLQWGTQRDNAFDAIRNGRAHLMTPEEREIGLSKMRRPILAINIKTGEEIRFRGQNEASRFLNIPQGNIWKVLNGERSRASGYYFEYIGGGTCEFD